MVVSSTSFSFCKEQDQSAIVSEIRVNFALVPILFSLFFFREPDMPYMVIFDL